jgi:hypothetical protein
MVTRTAPKKIYSDRLASNSGNSRRLPELFILPHEYVPVGGEATSFKLADLKSAAD